MRFFETTKVDDKTVEENIILLEEINNVIENTRLVEFEFKLETDKFKEQAVTFLESVFKDAGNASNELYECLISVSVDCDFVNIKVYGLKAMIQVTKKAKSYLK